MIAGNKGAVRYDPETGKMIIFRVIGGKVRPLKVNEEDWSQYFEDYLSHVLGNGREARQVAGQLTQYLVKSDAVVPLERLSQLVQAVAANENVQRAFYHYRQWGAPQQVIPPIAQQGEDPQAHAERVQQWFSRNIADPSLPEEERHARARGWLRHLNGALLHGTHNMHTFVGGEQQDPARFWDPNRPQPYVQGYEENRQEALRLHADPDVAPIRSNLGFLGVLRGNDVGGLDAQGFLSRLAQSAAGLDPMSGLEMDWVLDNRARGSFKQFEVGRYGFESRALLKAAREHHYQRALRQAAEALGEVRVRLGGEEMGLPQALGRIQELERRSPKDVDSAWEEVLGSLDPSRLAQVEAALRQEAAKEVRFSAEDKVAIVRRALSKLADLHDAATRLATDAAARKAYLDDLKGRKGASFAGPDMHYNDAYAASEFHEIASQARMAARGLMTREVAESLRSGPEGEALARRVYGMGDSRLRQMLTERDIMAGVGLQQMVPDTLMRAEIEALGGAAGFFKDLRRMAAAWRLKQERDSGGAPEVRPAEEWQGGGEQPPADSPQLPEEKPDRPEGPEPRGAREAGPRQEQAQRSPGEGMREVHRLVESYRGLLSELAERGVEGEEAFWAGMDRALSDLDANKTTTNDAASAAALAAGMSVVASGGGRGVVDLGEEAEPHHLEYAWDALRHAAGILSDKDRFARLMNLLVFEAYRRYDDGDLMPSDLDGCNSHRVPASAVDTADGPRWRLVEGKSAVEFTNALLKVTAELFDPRTFLNNDELGEDEKKQNRLLPEALLRAVGGPGAGSWPPHVVMGAELLMPELARRAASEYYTRYLARGKKPPDPGDFIGMSPDERARYEEEMEEVRAGIGKVLVSMARTFFDDGGRGYDRGFDWRNIRDILNGEIDLGPGSPDGPQQGAGGGAPEGGGHAPEGAGGEEPEGGSPQPEAGPGDEAEPRPEAEPEGEGGTSPDAGPEPQSPQGQEPSPEANAVPEGNKPPGVGASDEERINYNLSVLNGDEGYVPPVVGMGRGKNSQLGTVLEENYFERFASYSHKPHTSHCFRRINDLSRAVYESGGKIKVSIHKYKAEAKNRKSLVMILQDERGRKLLGVAYDHSKGMPHFALAYGPKLEKQMRFPMSADIKHLKDKIDAFFSGAIDAALAGRQGRGGEGDPGNAHEDEPGKGAGGELGPQPDHGPKAGGAQEDNPGQSSSPAAGAEPEAPPAAEPQADPGAAPEAGPRAKAKDKTKAKAKVTPKAKPEPGPQAKDKQEPGRETEVQPEAEATNPPEAAPETKPELGPESGPEAAVQPEAPPEPGPEPRPEGQSQAKEEEAEARPKAKAKTKAKAKAPSAVEAGPKGQEEAPPPPPPAPEAAVEPEAAKAEGRPNPEDAPPPKQPARPAAKRPAAGKPKAKADADPLPPPPPAPRPDPAPEKPEAKPPTGPAPENSQQPVQGQKPEPEAEPEPKPEAEAAPRPEPRPAPARAGAKGPAGPAPKPQAQPGRPAEEDAHETSFDDLPDHPHGKGWKALTTSGGRLRWGFVSHMAKKLNIPSGNLRKEWAKAPAPFRVAVNRLNNIVKSFGGKEGHDPSRLKARLKGDRSVEIGYAGSPHTAELTFAGGPMLRFGGVRSDLSQSLPPGNSPDRVAENFSMAIANETAPKPLQGFEYKHDEDTAPVRHVAEGIGESSEALKLAYRASAVARHGKVDPETGRLLEYHAEHPDDALESPASPFAAHGWSPAELEDAKHSLSRSLREAADRAGRGDPGFAGLEEEHVQGLRALADLFGSDRLRHQEAAELANRPPFSRVLSAHIRPGEIEKLDKGMEALDRLARAGVDPIGKRLSGSPRVGQGGQDHPLLRDIDRHVADAAKAGAAPKLDHALVGDFNVEETALEEPEREEARQARARLSRFLGEMQRQGRLKDGLTPGQKAGLALAAAAAWQTPGHAPVTEAQERYRKLLKASGFANAANPEHAPPRSYMSALAGAIGGYEGKDSDEIHREVRSAVAQGEGGEGLPEPFDAERAHALLGAWNLAWPSLRRGADRAEKNEQGGTTRQLRSPLVGALASDPDLGPMLTGGAFAGLDPDHGHRMLLRLAHKRARGDEVFVPKNLAAASHLSPPENTPGEQRYTYGDTGARARVHLVGGGRLMEGVHFPARELYDHYLLGAEVPEGVRQKEAEAAARIREVGRRAAEEAEDHLKALESGEQPEPEVKGASAKLVDWHDKPEPEIPQAKAEDAYEEDLEGDEGGGLTLGDLLERAPFAPTEPDKPKRRLKEVSPSSRVKLPASWKPHIAEVSPVERGEGNFIQREGLLDHRVRVRGADVARVLQALGHGRGMEDVAEALRSGVYRNYLQEAIRKLREIIGR